MIVLPGGIQCFINRTTNRKRWEETKIRFKVSFFLFFSPIKSGRIKLFLIFGGAVTSFLSKDNTERKFVASNTASYEIIIAAR